MKSSFMLNFLTFTMCSLISPHLLSAHGILDERVAVSSIADLDSLTLRLRTEPNMNLDWDAFSQAVTHILAYVSEEGALYISTTDKNQIVKVLVSGRTLREIIILGHVIWLEQIKQQIAESDQSPSVSPAEAAGLGSARNFDQGSARNAREVIQRYLKEKISGN